MKHVLVVDNDPASCAAATAILRELDCAVETAVDGDTAMQQLLRAVPDAVLVGLNIADMAGGAFVGECHQAPRCGNVPVVVMAVTPRAAVNAIREGARLHPETGGHGRHGLGTAAVAQLATEQHVGAPRRGYTLCWQPGSPATNGRLSTCGPTRC